MFLQCKKNDPGGLKCYKEALITRYDTDTGRFCSRFCRLSLETITTTLSEVFIQEAATPDDTTGGSFNKYLHNCSLVLFLDARFFISH